MTIEKINAIIIKLNDTEHKQNERVQRKEQQVRQCWNWQTGTFEGRVSLTYGFKSRLPHQVRKLANPLSMRVCEFFCFTIKTASEQPLTTARKLMLYLSYIAYPCSIFLLAHDPIPHSPVNKTQNPTCRHRQPYCRYAYDRYQGVGENNSEREIYYASG